MLTREQILSANDTPTREVPVPEWGGNVRVRTMSARDKDFFELAAIRARNDGDVNFSIRARYAAFCIIDEKGEPVFTDEDIEALGNKSSAALDRVYQAIEELNRLDPNEVEALAKN